MKHRTRHYSFVLFILFLNVLMLEILAYSFGHLYLSKMGLVYIDEIPSGDEFQVYLDIRDPILGWPAPTSYGSGDLDKTGARINTYFPDIDTSACVSTYGDSFTFSKEVDNVSAYPNQLSRILGCRVNNYGVSGYGTDQAVIRFQHNKTDYSKFIVLAHVSEDIIRNVNQFRGLLSGNRFGFKPRFVLAEDSGLKLVPIMDFTENYYKNVYKRPSDYLHHEYFIPDGPSGVPPLKFPYTLAIAKSLFSYKFHGYLHDRTAYTDPFYDIEHRSNALKITQLIIQEFEKEARRRDATPLVVIVPIVVDILARQSTGTWPYQELIDYLENDSDIEYIDFGEVLFNHIKQEKKTVCDFYRKEWYAKGGCTGHFNKSGYLLLATTVASKLRSMRFYDSSSKFIQ